jgi:uncharacterized protein YgbK (DUF1537 family)
LTVEAPFLPLLPMTTSPLLLGAIADDFTGATDLANNLVRAGLRTVQWLGVPEAGTVLPEGTEAVVVALKSRTIEPAEAVAQSLAAWRWLAAQGARCAYFKVCSTFDSTERGNIGPVAEALREATGAAQVLVCPAFPATGRTVYRGHLFVGDVLLSDSGMRDHPLTPMTDANLVRVLQRQARARVGLLPWATLQQGEAATAAALAALRQTGTPLVVADALDDADLHRLGPHAVAAGLVVAGSGLALGMAAPLRAAASVLANVGAVGHVSTGTPPTGARTDPPTDAPTDAARLPPARGARAILSGSCSVASNAQVAAFRATGGEAFALDPLRLARGEDLVGEALAWACERLGERPVLIHATAAPEAVKAVQQALGAEAAGALIEGAMARLAQGLAAAGVGALVVAGGETSGAVVQALGLRRLRIGAQIDPGVPWTHAEWTPSPELPRGLHLALKSGNFGGPDFFTRAFTLLDTAA